MNSWSPPPDIHRDGDRDLQHRQSAGMDARNTALVNEKNGEVIYTPPEGDSRLRDMLANSTTATG